MNGNMKVHGHCNGLKTVFLFGLMWAIIMLIWWLTGASQDTLGVYLVIGVASTFISYWFFGSHLHRIDGRASCLRAGST